MYDQIENVCSTFETVSEPAFDTQAAKTAPEIVVLLDSGDS